MWLRIVIQWKISKITCHLSQKLWQNVESQCICWLMSRHGLLNSATAIAIDDLLRPWGLFLLLLFTTVVCVICLLCVLEFPLLNDNDLRILPSADSHSDISFDDNSQPPCCVPSTTLPPCDDPLTGAEKPSLNYASGRACRRMLFLPPADSDAQPLQREDLSVSGCHCEFHFLIH